MYRYGKYIIGSFLFLILAFLPISIHAMQTTGDTNGVELADHHGGHGGHWHGGNHWHGGYYYGGYPGYYNYYGYPNYYYTPYYYDNYYYPGYYWDGGGIYFSF